MKNLIVSSHLQFFLVSFINVDVKECSVFNNTATFLHLATIMRIFVVRSWTATNVTFVALVKHID